jgi:hypothetical protein
MSVHAAAARETLTTLESRTLLNIGVPPAPLRTPEDVAANCGAKKCKVCTAIFD